MTTAEIASPAIAKGLEFLKRALAEQRWLAGDRLPSLVDLAAMAGVSRNSMWRALQVAKRDRLVTIVKGGYITAGDDSLAGASPGKRHSIPQRSAAWEEIQAELERNILDG